MEEVEAFLILGEIIVLREEGVEDIDPFEFGIEILTKLLNSQKIL